MNAEEAVKLVWSPTLSASERLDVIEFIRRQADDLAAIEKYHRTNGMPPIASHIGEPNEPDEWVVLHTENLSYHPTLADACRAATKGAG